MNDLELKFSADLWIVDGPGAWHFLTLPPQTSESIKHFYGKRHGFGTIRIKVRVGKTEWKTSLFPDKASNSFLLPVKSAIRKKAQLSAGDHVTVSLSVEF